MAVCVPILQRRADADAQLHAIDATRRKDINLASAPGDSMACCRSRRKSAASAPEMMRWSHVNVTIILFSMPMPVRAFGRWTICGFAEATAR